MTQSLKFLPGDSRPFLLSSLPSVVVHFTLLAPPVHARISRGLYYLPFLLRYPCSSRVFFPFYSVSSLALPFPISLFPPPSERHFLTYCLPIILFQSSFFHFLLFFRPAAETRRKACAPLLMFSFPSGLVTPSLLATPRQAEFLVSPFFSLTPFVLFFPAIFSYVVSRAPRFLGVNLV